MIIPSETLEQMKSEATRFTLPSHIEEVGTVLSVSGSIVTISGLPHVTYLETVTIRGSDGNLVSALVIDLLPDSVSAALLDNSTTIAPGSEVHRTGTTVQVPVGFELLGRVVDGLGRPLDGKGEIRTSEFLPAERESVPILHRCAVEVPIQTGISAIDALIPVGRGQRELIIGDRQTGKTAIAVDTILNQKNSGVLAVYCAVGIPLNAVSQIIHDLTEGGAMEYTVVVAASGNDTPGLNYIAPYAATSIAEFFMESGRDVVIVYDDLTRHARSYRELSLLLRRPPAREAFPGDIFYLHSRLLERATHLKPEFGGGSLTALPIAETEAQNISAYIPTNLISITDGQIYLSPKLYARGQLPAIDVMRSVSRVGGQAQRAALRSVAGELRLAFAQFEELEAFSRFDTALDAATMAVLERGRRVRIILRQNQAASRTVFQQTALIIALGAGLFDSVELDQMERAVALCATIETGCHDVAEQIEQGEKLSPEMKEMIISMWKSVITGVM